MSWMRLNPGRQVTAALGWQSPRDQEMASLLLLFSS
jgi:hypothetical protein